MKTLLTILIILSAISAFGQDPCKEEMVDGIYQLRLDPKTKTGKRIHFNLTVLLVDTFGNSIGETRIDLIDNYGVIYEMVVTDENGKALLTNFDNKKIFYLNIERNGLFIKQKIDFFQNIQENLEKEIKIKWKKTSPNNG